MLNDRIDRFLELTDKEPDEVSIEEEREFDNLRDELRCEIYATFSSL